MNITGDGGILSEIKEETSLDEAYKLDKFIALYREFHELELSLNTYDKLDIDKVDDALEKVPFVVENPYNDESFSNNLESFNRLIKICDGRKLTPAESKELHGVCMTLKKQKNEFENKLTDETWETIYNNTLLVIKIIFIDAYEVNYKKCLNSNDKIEILTRDNTDDETILYKKSKNETINFYITSDSDLDNLFDKVLDLNNNRQNITINDIKWIISKTKEILLEQYWIRSKTNDVSKMDEDDCLYNKNCKRHSLRYKTVTVSSSDE